MKETRMPPAHAAYFGANSGKAIRGLGYWVWDLCCLTGISTLNRCYPGYYETSKKLGDFQVAIRQTSRNLHSCFPG